MFLFLIQGTNIIIFKLKSHVIAMIASSQINLLPRAGISGNVGSYYQAGIKIIKNYQREDESSFRINSHLI